MSQNPLQKREWEMLVECLQLPVESRGYTVPGLTAAVSDRFATRVSRRSVRDNLKRLQRARIGLQIQVHRLGRFRRPVAFYRLPTPA